MGSVFTSLFGGGQQSVDIPEYESTPIITEAETSEPEAQAVREEQQRRIRSRRAGSGTILTTPLGASNSASSGSGILGKSL